VAGGLAAGVLFILPGALVMAALGLAYAAWGGLPALGAVVAGLSLAVLVLVAEALWRLGRRVLRSAVPWVLAAAALFALAFGALPFPLLLFAGLAIGAAIGVRWPAAFGGALPPAAAPAPAARARSAPGAAAPADRHLRRTGQGHAAHAGHGQQIAGAPGAPRHRG
jgi:chromate transporter